MLPCIPQHYLCGVPLGTGDGCGTVTACHGVHSADVIPCHARIPSRVIRAEATRLAYSCILFARFPSAWKMPSNMFQTGIFHASRNDAAQPEAAT